MTAAACLRAVQCVAYAALLAERDRLADTCRAMPHWHARRLAGVSRRLDYDDAVQVGEIARLRAAERFNPSRGWKFSTYCASVIRREVRREAETTTLIHVPAYQFQPTAPNYSRDRSDVRRALGCRSAARFVEKGYETACGDVGDEPAAPAPPCPLEAAEDRERLRRALRKLLPRWRAVVRMRFGVDGYEPHTLAEVGHKLNGVTRENVRQIEARALARLRKILDGPA